MIKKLLSICIGAFISWSSFSQTIDLGEPTSWNGNLGGIESFETYTMSGFDRVAIDIEDAIHDAAKDAPWRFGYKYDTDYTLINSGTWTNLPNGDRLWRIGFKCQEAMTINLLMENFFIPEGAFMHLYDVNHTNVIGAFTSKNNSQGGLLGTELVHGEHVILEYYEPASVNGQGHLTVSNVVHGYRSLDRIQKSLIKALNDSGDCNIDVNCPLGIGWENQIRSVAMIVVGGSGICSGALINNTCDDGTAYFLTADHCLGGANVGANLNWAFRFNWKSPPGTESCATTTGSTDPGTPYDQTAYGATVLVQGTEADHALLQIDNMTLTDAQSWNVFYAGWNNDDTDGLITQATGIHHPSGDLMKICREDDAPFHNNSAGADVWYINSWEQGVTEPGSSGSPLFDQNGRIIGQLYGGLAACSGTVNNGTYDYYGRLGVSWGLGIAGYLAPTACGIAITNDGWDPNTPTLDYTLEVLTSSLEVCQPDDAVYTINIGELGGYIDPVTLSVSGLPLGVTANFSQNPVTPVGTSNLTISNTAAATPGFYSLTLEANSTSGIKTVDLDLIIGSNSPAPSSLLTPMNGAIVTMIPTDFSWSPSMAPGTTYSIEISTDAGFSLLIDQATGLTAESFSSANLNMNTVYYWRVMTLTSCGTSSWSAIYSFTTGGCLTNTSTDIPITIPANGTPVVTSTIDFVATGIINDVNVIDLIGTHTRVKNLVITLQSPLGTTVTLMDQPCNNNHSDFNVDYDDAAATGVLPCAPVDGNAYQPIGLLSDFNGEDAFGTWILIISDMVNNSGGELQTWSLEICTDPETPCLSPELPITSGTSSICSGSTTTLSVVSGNLNDATDWNWYETSCGGTLIGSGASVDVSPIVNTTYFVRGEGGCVTPGLCEEVTVLVNPIYNETANALTCGGSPYVFGTQTLTVPGDYTEVFTSVNGCDSTVVLTLSSIAAYNETASAIICEGDSYIFGAQTLTTSGPYTELFTSVTGCDSTVILTLTVTPAFNETASAIICEGDSYIFGAQTLTTPGPYTELFTSANGCDSTVVLTLTVAPAYNETAMATICQGDSYIFGTQTLTTAGPYNELFTSVDGCDSTVVLTLTINPAYNETASATICAGDSYIFGTQTLTTSGPYTELFTTIDGCDSTVVLTLTVENIDNTVTQTGSTLSSNQDGAIYQWVDCDNGNSEIFGETNQTYTPTTNTGNYAVIVTSGSCSETSACYLVDDAGVEEEELSFFSIFPNPSNGVVNVKLLKKPTDNFRVSVLDLSGRIVFMEDKLNNDSFIVDLSSMASGTYMIRINAGGDQSTQRIVLRK